MTVYYCDIHITIDQKPVDVRNYKKSNERITVLVPRSLWITKQFLLISLHLILFSFQQLHLLSQPFNDLKLFHLYMPWIMCTMKWLSKILQIHLTLELTPIPYNYGHGFSQPYFVLYALHSYILRQGKLRRTAECFRVPLTLCIVCLF